MTNAKTQDQSTTPPTTPTRRDTPRPKPGETAAHWIAQGIDATTALVWENID